MSFNKKFIGTRKELKKEYFSLGHEEFRRIYFKVDAFIGGTEKARKFLENVLKKNKKYKSKKDLPKNNKS